MTEPKTELQPDPLAEAYDQGSLPLLARDIDAAGVAITDVDFARLRRGMVKHGRYWAIVDLFKLLRGWGCGSLPPLSETDLATAREGAGQYALTIRRLSTHPATMPNLFDPREQLMAALRWTADTGGQIEQLKEYALVDGVEVCSRRALTQVAVYYAARGDLAGVMEAFANLGAISDETYGSCLAAAIRNHDAETAQACAVCLRRNLTESEMKKLEAKHE